jgi:hypothetical protein
VDGLKGNRVLIRDLHNLRLGLWGKVSRKEGEKEKL